MDNAEAREILRAQLEPYRRWSYAALAAQVGQEPMVREVQAASGVAYQVEIEAIWDHRPGSDVRVMGAIDDGGWRSFVPLGDAFIMAPDGSFIGEEPASE